MPPDSLAQRRPQAGTLLLLASLYCAQGLPSGLLAHALPVLLRQHGVDLALIGLLKLLALPWLLKVFWAPWLDRLASPRLGHHRGWILPLQGGFTLILLGLGLLVLLLLIPLLRFPERRVLPFHAALAEPAGVTLPWRHYRGLLALPGMGLWLLVLLSFKLGDALGSPMIKPMLVDQGWGAAALGQLTLVSSLVGIGGALVGGWLYARLGVLRALLLGGVLQAVGIAGMALLVGRAEVAPVYAVALFEQFADGLSTVVLFAAMMRQCRPEHEGADFTLQASVQLLLGGIVGAFSGVLAKLLGYPGLFLLAGGLGVAALGVVLAARATLRR